jgi:hypothetical protein
MFEDVYEMWRGVALVISNVGLVPGISISLYYGLFPEAAIYSVVCFISTMYHLCQANFYCFYSFRTLQTSDHFFVFGLLVWTVLYFINLDISTRSIVFIVIQSLLLPAVIQYLESWWIGGILLAFMLIFTLVTLSMFTKRIPNLDLFDIIVILLLIGGGFFFHIYGGEPGSTKYWWAHSIWHFLGMLAVYFVIEMKDGKGTLNRILLYYRRKNKAV